MFILAIALAATAAMASYQNFSDTVPKAKHCKGPLAHRAGMVCVKAPPHSIKKVRFGKVFQDGTNTGGMWVYAVPVQKPDKVIMEIVRFSEYCENEAIGSWERPKPCEAKPKPKPKPPCKMTMSEEQDRECTKVYSSSSTTIVAGAFGGTANVGTDQKVDLGSESSTNQVYVTGSVSLEFEGSCQTSEPGPCQGSDPPPDMPGGATY